MKALICIAVILASLTGHAANSQCELRCSLAYTVDVRRCEHEPNCLQTAHQKYDACAARCP